MKSDYHIRGKLDDIRGWSLNEIAEKFLDMEEEIASLSDEVQDLREEVNGLFEQAKS